MLRLALYGHSGSGKSTAADLTERFFRSRGLTVTRLKLAQPLYELQTQFYRVAGVGIGFFDQDQRLLETIATELRRISPTSLVDDFERRLAAVDADVCLNDDVRDVEVDYPRLRELGFRFVRIWCDEGTRRERLGGRGDLSVVLASATTAAIDRIRADVVVDNSDTDLDGLRAVLEDVLGAYV
jgi:dephospho-CoA kinase